MRISSVNFLLSVLFVVAVSIFTMKPLFSSTEGEYQEAQQFEQQLSPQEESASLSDLQAYIENHGGEEEEEEEEEEEDKYEDQYEEGSEDEDEGDNKSDN